MHLRKVGRFDLIRRDTVNVLLAATACNFKRAMKALPDLVKRNSGIPAAYNISLKTNFQGTTIQYFLPTDLQYPWVSS